MADLLRVVLVVGSTSGGIGGHVRSLARGLADRGHEVRIVGPAATDELFAWAQTGAVFVDAPVGAVSPRRLAAAVRAIRGESRDADVVHAHGTRAGAVAALAGVGHLVLTWHNARPSRLGRRLAHPVAERLGARRASIVLAVSADLAERARRVGARRVRVVAVPAPALPPPARSPRQVRAQLGAENRPLLLAVARLEPQKRLDLLVDATAGWDRRPDRPMVAVAGTGSLAGSLVERARRAGSPLRLLGRRDDIADLLAAADVVVLPSAWEGYPLVAQEALQAGVPLVATAVGGVPDLVGEAAVLVPPADAAALRSAVEGLLEDPVRRRLLAEAGRRQAAQWPTLTETVDELVGIYRTLQ